ncbi:MAG: L,D-transpeptidase family protein [Myxococcota bacterium]
MNHHPKPNHPTLLRWPLLLFLCIGLLALGCSGRLDEQEAADATRRAATLYPKEFTRRAPRLTRKVIRKAIADHLSQAQTDGHRGPSLTEDDLNLDQPRFVNLNGALDESLMAVRSICSDLPRHDLPTASYPCAALETEVKRLGELMETLDTSLERTELETQQTTRIRDHLLAADPETVRDEDGSVSDATLIRIMFGGDDTAASSLLPEALGHLEGIGSTVGRIADTMARVEIHGHMIIMRLAWDLRASHAAQVWQRTQERNAWLNALADRELERTGEPQPRLRPKVGADWPQSADDAQQLSLRESMALLDRLSVAQVARVLQPAGDQYARLLTAHDRYRAILADGGFEPVPRSIKLRRKRSKDLVAIRARLRQEGFESGDGGEDGPETMDKALRNAIKAFQRAHQLKDKGRLNDDTLEAMAIPVREKLERVRLAMHRWRETTPRGNYYVMVNIPDYYGEVWKNGTRQHRFRVVVGNAKSGIKDGKRMMINATQAMDATIDRVIMNPYWNVPSRIFKREILNADMKEMEPDERAEELSSRGYQLMGKGSRGEWVRQPPGPGNALGQVKIIFPNPHETYLHDTPSKSLFKRPRRAFSHGCVRVHEPLRLARMLLQNDGQYDRIQVDDLLSRWENHTFLLHHQVPIHIEYITVRVDDRGFVHFLDDVYGHDARRLAMR